MDSEMKRYYKIKQNIERFRFLRRIYRNIAEVTLIDQFHKGKTTTHYPGKYAEVFDHGNLELYNQPTLNEVQMSLTGKPYIE